MTKPVIKRQQNVIKAGKKSAFPGLIFHSLNLFTFNIKYQIKASEGILCISILVITPDVENPEIAPVPEIAAAAPDKNRTMYNNNASIYIINIL